MNQRIKTVFLAHDRQESPEPRKNYLEHAGFNVRLFSSSQELVSAFREETPACVVMDVLLEGRNGFEIAQEIHRAFSGRSFPIVLCSRLYRGRAFQEEAIRCGVSTYLLMPMALEEFLNQVCHAIEDYRPSTTSRGLDLAI